MRSIILCSHQLFLFCLVILSFSFFGVSFNVADAVSVGTVDFSGSEVTSNIPQGAHYQHDDLRKVSSNVEVTAEGDSRRVVLEEKWKSPLGKPPDITVFTLKVTAKGQGRILLTLNRNSGGPTSNEDIGSYRGSGDPVALENDKDFFLRQYVPHKNIRKYQNGFDSPYDDDCVPVKHKGYNLEVVTGNEDLDAVGKVFSEKVSIAYGKEKNAQNALGLGGGWNSAAIEANFVNGTKSTWGWKLTDHPQNWTGHSIDSSFSVTVEDSVYERQGQPQDKACDVCENCGEFLHDKNKHYIGLCPLDKSVSGCGEKRWSCEPPIQLAWHKIRDCYNFVTVPLPLVGGPTKFCPERFRHCKNPPCDFRIKEKRGHSDGTKSKSPPGVPNPTPESHLFVAAPAVDNTPACDLCTDGCSACPTPGLSSANGSYISSPGGTHTADLITDGPYSQVYWYVKAPWETTALGTNVEIDSGDGTTIKASLNYTFPSGAMHTGLFKITAYIYPSSGSVYEYSYTVHVSLD